jgi:hypothetical protein
MPEHEPKPKKPKGYSKLTQRKNFLAAAKAAEADESGETFEQAFRKIVPQKGARHGR